MIETQEQQPTVASQLRSEVDAPKAPMEAVDVAAEVVADAEELLVVIAIPAILMRKMRKPQIIIQC